MNTRTNDLSIREFAAQANRSTSTVKWWLTSGRIPGAYREGCHWRIPPQHAVPPARKPRAPHYPPFA